MKRLPLLIVCVVVVVVVLFSPRAHYADTGVFVPQSAHGTPPNLNNNVGDSRTVNCFYYLPAATYQGSTLNNPDYSASVMPAQCTLLDVKTGVFVCTNLQQATVSATCAASNDSGSNSVAFNWQIGNTSPVANGYFVDCNAGNDGNSGVDYLHPWRTLGKVNSTSIPTSADLWIKSGTTCANQSLNTHWAGTSGDRVVVGTYYISGGVAYQLLPDNILGSAQDGTQGWSHGSRAIIQGSYQPSCRVWPSKCPFLGAGGAGTPGSPIVPSNVYQGLVQNDGYEYVTVQSLDIRDSAGYGISLDPYNRFGNGVYRCTTDVRCKMYFIAQYNKVSHTATTGMAYFDGQYATMRGNDIEYTGLSRADSQPGGADGGGIYVGHCDPCHIIVENNYFHDVFNEGMGVGDGAFMLIRGNRYANNKRTGIYVDGGADIIVEQNIAGGGPYTVEPGLGNPNPTQGSDFGPAFYTYSLIKEPDPGSFGAAAAASLRNIFRNNMAANFESCTSIGMSVGTIGANGGFWGNTCIGAPGKKATDVTANGFGIVAPGVQFENNIFAVTSGTTNCVELIDTTLLPFDHNFWTGAPTEPFCRRPGTGDVYGTYAGLSLVSAFAHFADADKSNFPAASDFQIANGSTAASGGTDLSATYLDTTAWAWEIANMTWYPSCAGGLASSADWAKKNYLDYCNVARTFGSRGALNRN